MPVIENWQLIKVLCFTFYMYQRFYDTMNFPFLLLIFCAAGLLIGCSGGQEKTNAGDTSRVQKVPPAKKDTVQKIYTGDTWQQVPVLSYHRIGGQRSGSVLYFISEENFRQQVQHLADSGYHTILPDQLYQHLTQGVPLPEKPIMLTFDDTRLEHYTIAARELEKHGFKGVFFIMTISINRPRYMSAEQIKSLADRGHEIGCHTWDHTNMKKLNGADWNIQVAQPKQKLETITGRPVVYFAYPFGVWSDSAIIRMKEHGFKAAFQLSGRHSEQEPLFTLPRLMVAGDWSISRFELRVNAAYKK